VPECTGPVYLKTSLARRPPAHAPSLRARKPSENRCSATRRAAGSLPHVARHLRNASAQRPLGVGLHLTEALDEEYMWTILKNPANRADTPV
jgi:hypothetical protein